MVQESTPKNSGFLWGNHLVVQEHKCQGEGDVADDQLAGCEWSLTA